MKLPRDQVVYANLQTSFVLFDGLLGELGAREIDGYVQLKAPERAGAVYLSGGAVCGASFRDGQGEHTGEEALERVQVAVREHGGTIWVFEAPRALIRLAASKGQREAVYRDLSTEFVDVERLVETLTRDDHTGYVEVLLRNAPSAAYLFMDDGEVVDAVLADDSHAGSGLHLVPTILKAVEASGATLHVWKAAGLFAGAARTAADAAPTHGPETHPMVDQPVAPIPPEELEDLGKTWAAILGAVEGVVDGASEPGQFTLVLREVQREHARAMPYLDPDTGLFDYRDGRVRFHQPPPGNFTSALGDCLGDAIARISFRLRKADLETLIHRELAAVLESRAQSIARHGISRSASSFLAA